MSVVIEGIRPGLAASTGAVVGHQPASGTTGCSEAVKQVRHGARGAFPDLNTVEGQDQFFNVVGLEHIGACFDMPRADQEALYWMRLDEHASTRAEPVATPVTRATTSVKPQRQTSIALPLSFTRQSGQPTTVAPARPRLKTKDVPGDGDCFFHSVLEAHAQPLAGLQTPAKVRNEVGKRLAGELAELNRSIREGKDPAALIEKAPYLAVLPDVHRLPPDAKAPASLTPAQTAFINTLRTGHSWNHDAGDLYAAIFAHTFRLQVQVYTDYGQQAFGDPAWPLVPVYLSGGHYRPVVGD